MDRYQKVEKPKIETPIDENEIRITSQGRMRSYITYAMTLLQEKGSDDIVFKAMGRAINKTVTIVELIKRRIVGLHQITAIQSTDITDTWEPLEEGLQILETTRKVSMVTITLSKKELDTKNVGYQQPIPEDQVKVLSPDVDYDGGGRDRLLPVEEAEVAEGGGDLDSSLGMALLMLSMMMEAMKGTVGMPEVGDEVEAVVSVAVEGVATMVLWGMLSMMLEPTIKKHHELSELVVMQVVAVGGEFGEGVVGSELMCLSKQLLEMRRCSKLGFIIVQGQGQYVL
ncbi:hypothetical protein SASPL_103589 [Salvia splendens]|uniref:DNA/RNA-binding protein Alba-like domain-containing protein n=1 Tax=Salvia splendens TaxID=180675 RepID=A0A8X8YL99_SALSN|nr:hypothetical protein SASPL_103589 [Salvia splendens]